MRREEIHNDDIEQVNNNPKQEYITEKKEGLSLKKIILSFFSIILVLLIIVGIKYSITFAKSNAHNNTTGFEERLPTSSENAWEISQIVFQCAKSDEHEKCIRDCLDSNNIQYSDFYYTDEGYYTADLTGYPETTKSRYIKQSEDLKETLDNYEWTFEINCEVSGRVRLLW